MYVVYFFLINWKILIYEDYISKLLLQKIFVEILLENGQALSESKYFLTTRNILSLSYLLPFFNILQALARRLALLWISNKLFQVQTIDIPSWGFEPTVAEWLPTWIRKRALYHQATTAEFVLSSLPEIYRAIFKWPIIFGLSRVAKTDLQFTIYVNDGKWTSPFSISRIF